MKRLFDDDMDRLTADESERLWRELEMASLEPRRTVMDVVRPIALGATAVGALVLVAGQDRWRHESKTADDKVGIVAVPPDNRLSTIPYLGGPAAPPESKGAPDHATTPPMVPPTPLGQAGGVLPAHRPKTASPLGAAAGQPVMSTEEVDVTGVRQRIERESSSTKQKIGMEDLKNLPVHTYREAVATKAGVVSQKDEHTALARPEEGTLNIATNAVSSSNLLLPPTPDPLSTGGTAPVNGEPRDATFFESAGVNPFVDTEEDALATFAMDVDNASYTIARSYLENNSLPPADAVRVEEFINAVRHDYAPPASATASMLGDRSAREDFAIHLDAAPSPFGKGLTLLRVGLKAREVAVADRKPCTLTFVIDVSGSMGTDNRLGLVKQALGLLLDQMTVKDEVGIVVYGTDARVVLPPTSLARRDEILRAIDWLRPEGSTNVQAGLREAYRMADQAMRSGRVNRIVLCSDGVANNGVTEGDAILDEVRREARRGIELTAVGFGMSNYNDVLMEKLADHGDGSYWYVDRLEEARRVFVESLTGTLQTVARQAKVQVEFDPARVSRYRLLGYENRDVADRDFRNDAIDAGEVGAGHEVTALFELKLREERPAVTSTGSGALATVRIRYEDPDTRQVSEVSRSLWPSDVLAAGRTLPPGLALDASVAEFAEVLHHSYWSKESTPGDALALARRAVARLGDRADRLELLGMMETADRLWPAERRHGWRGDGEPSGE
jgi:Ca-activated chloride channel family protein